MAATGLRQRHGLNCKGGRCSCPWEASVYSKTDCKKIRKTFDTRAGALEWQEASKPKVRQGAMRAPTAQTFREASKAWMDGARSGLIRTRAGHPFKPAALRAYDDALRLRVLPALGSKRLGDVRRNDVQDLVDKLLAAGDSPSTISVALLPIRATLIVLGLVPAASSLSMRSCTSFLLTSLRRLEPSAGSTRSRRASS